jgi:hypothetical protein
MISSRRKKRKLRRCRKNLTLTAHGENNKNVVEKDRKRYQKKNEKDEYWNAETKDR